MREIEFRGKRKDNGKWVYGSLVIDNNKYYIVTQVNYPIPIDKYEVYDDDYSVMMYEVDPETVGQYTGLKDRNGTKIYEGDIVKQVFYRISSDEFGCKGFYEDIFKIRYQGRAFKYDWIRTNKIEMPKDYKEDYIEVIGNIVDNKELLEE